MLHSCLMMLFQGGKAVYYQSISMHSSAALQNLANVEVGRLYLNGEDKVWRTCGYRNIMSSSNEILHNQCFALIFIIPLDWLPYLDSRLQYAQTLNIRNTCKGWRR